MSVETMDPALKVFDGLEVRGRVNVSDEALLANVAGAIRRGHPQVRVDPVKPQRVCLVGGGPSLGETFAELRQLVFEGAILATVNGAYAYCVERNLRPQIQIVMDARESNARFVDPVVPHCRYLLASQCHPATWDAVEGRENVWIFHAAAGADGALKDLLDGYYGGQWVGIGGATTVATRAINLLRTLGYLRFDLFGVDSCWLDGQHHAYPQAENDGDRLVRVSLSPPDHPEIVRTFACSPWHVKQAEDFAQILRVQGHQFKVAVHGDGLLAYMVRSSATAMVIDERAATNAAERSDA